MREMERKEIINNETECRRGRERRMNKNDCSESQKYYQERERKRQEVDQKNKKKDEYFNLRMDR